MKQKETFFVDSACRGAFEALGLTSVEGVFAFGGGKNLAKANIGGWRSRVEFEADGKTFFLKRYDRTPMLIQVKNWIGNRGRKSTAAFDSDPAEALAAMGIGTPKTVAMGAEWGAVFEKRSFIVTEKISNAEALERKLPDRFSGPASGGKIEERREFIGRLGKFVKKFHETGYRHRDLYLSHVFYGDAGEFYLIDLARVVKPSLASERLRVKDIAQLHYSAPGSVFSNCDRLRYYRAYSGCEKLRAKDKDFIGKVNRRARRMSKHDARHGRRAPFAK